MRERGEEKEGERGMGGTERQPRRTSHDRLPPSLAPPRLLSLPRERARLPARLFFFFITLKPRVERYTKSMGLKYEPASELLRASGRAFPGFVFRLRRVHGPGPPSCR